MKKRYLITLIVFLIFILVPILIKAFIFHSSIYSVKSDFFTWVGDTRVYNSPHNISNEDVEKLKSLLEPGDIIINRSDYYLSNYAIPGYWKHVGIYIGEPKSINKDSVKCRGTIIESVSTGVVLTDIDEGLNKDGVVIFRPRLSKNVKAVAIRNALQQLNKAYDFNFDFSSDSTIACTELLKIAFDDNQIIPVNQFMGLPFTTANEIVEAYSFEGFDEKLELVCIYMNGELKIAENDNDIGELLLESLE